MRVTIRLDRDSTHSGTQLTRGNATNAITLPLPHPKSNVTIQPASSALVIIDMQNFFLVFIP
jgi:hypothetical protein